MGAQEAYGGLGVDVGCVHGGLKEGDVPGGRGGWLLSNKAVVGKETGVAVLGKGMQPVG